jgi:hypothetical protein
MANVELRNYCYFIHKKKQSDTWRRRLRCASDIHHSSFFNRPSSFQVVSHKVDDMANVETEVKFYLDDIRLMHQRITEMGAASR